MMTQTVTNDRKSFILQIVPVMLCFFAMGFVDLVGIASNYVDRKSTRLNSSHWS